jgi:hypothetical protein
MGGICKHGSEKRYCKKCNGVRCQFCERSFSDKRILRAHVGTPKCVMLLRQITDETYGLILKEIEKRVDYAYGSDDRLKHEEYLNYLRKTYHRYKETLQQIDPEEIEKQKNALYKRVLYEHSRLCTI